MTRYVAFLRGVSPMNAKMPELKRCFEAAGFDDVCTLLSSGNVVFSSRTTPEPALEKRAEQAMQQHLGRGFGTFVRRAEDLQLLVHTDPFLAFDLPANAKPVVTFLRGTPVADLALPIERGGAAILHCEGTEVFSAYVPGDDGPVFMQLLERTFGSDITTRTFDTVKKCALA